jgi:hypothetical protein
VRDRLKISGGSTVVGTFGFMAPEQFQGRASEASSVAQALERGGASSASDERRSRGEQEKLAGSVGEEGGRRSGRDTPPT